MSERPTFTVEYIEPVEAEPLPDEFSAPRLRRSLVLLTAVVIAVTAAIVLLPGLGSLRSSFMGAQPEWLVLAAVLQLGSCAGYVLVFRGVFCRRMRWPTSTEIWLSELAANSVFSIGGAGGLALWCVDPAARRTPWLVHRAAHGGVLPVDECRERRLPRARRVGAGHRCPERVARAGVRARSPGRRGGGGRARPGGAAAGRRAGAALDARPA